MGFYINPGYEGFKTKRNGDYADKSGLIAVVNATIDRSNKLSCISRPRRFGKSTAAQMLSAYYDCSVDSSVLFDDLEIAGSPDYRKYMNQFNVLYLDMTQAKTDAGGYENVIRFLVDVICDDLEKLPGVERQKSLPLTLEEAVNKTGRKFIAIIDEWDSPVRDRESSDKLQWTYLEFLRSLLKSSASTDKVFAAAYMTGILPVKKDGSQSAISEFREYSILDPAEFAPYTGFNEEDVKRLCDKHDLDFRQMKKWYDGYKVGTQDSVYNPNSVMEAVKRRKFRSYWQQSASSTALLDYINMACRMNYGRVAEVVPQLMMGKSVPVDVRRFKNDLISFGDAEDVLTLLIHFGYLNYDEEKGSARIPNMEIMTEFDDIVRRIEYTDTIRRVKESDELIESTLKMDATAVARQIERVHSQEYTPRFYNNEQSLRGVIKLAYFAYKEKFMQLEEVPGGTGYADLIFIPKNGLQLPALVVELKWDKDADTAIKQIKEKRYTEPIQDWGGGILLVGISYDKDDPEKKHACIIEEWS